MKRLLIIILSSAAISACAPEWTPLYDGKTLEGWTDVDGQEMPSDYWSVIDGAIVSHPDVDGEFSGATKDLMTTGTYTNFRLKLSFRLEEGGNGGIKYFINPGTFTGKSIGFEYQIIDDDNFRRVHFPITNVQTTASLYDILSSNKMDADYRPYEWNEAMIVVRDGHIEHWLNGVKVLELDRFSHAFDVLVTNSKFNGEEGFGKLEGGHILLQDHGSRVRYRDIMIQKLK